jgi:hypothetical protein
MTTATRSVFVSLGISVLIVTATLTNASPGSGLRQPGIIASSGNARTEAAREAPRGDPPHAEARSAGCLTCHTRTDEATMHPGGTVVLGCADCHGGNPAVSAGASEAPGSAAYVALTRKAHPQPKNTGLWKTAANPERAYTEWLQETEDYIQFVNPGDFRVVDRTCGTCHAAEVRNSRTSMMTHGAMLWGAALYNNGAVPFKTPRFGESYAPDGTPQRLQTWPPPTSEEMRE